MKSKLVLCALVFLLGFCTVNAVGINPGLTTADYSPNSKVDGTYSIHNRESVPVDVVITTKGDLAKYLTVPETKITVPANGVYPTSFSLLMPENLAPGKYETRIHLAETSSKSFLAFAVEYVIVVDVPYQGKHLTPYLIIGGESTDNLIMSASATNDGSAAVQSSRISVSVTDSSGKVMFSGTENTGGVDVKQYVSKLFQSDKTNWPESTYTVKMDLAYDGKTESVSQSFGTTTTKVEQPPAESKQPETKLPENIIPPSTEKPSSGIMASLGNNKFAIVGILIIVIMLLFVAFNVRKRKGGVYYPYQYPYR